MVSSSHLVVPLVVLTTQVVCKNPNCPDGQSVETKTETCGMDLACFALGVTPQAVYRLVKVGQLKARRREGQPLQFDTASLMALVKKREGRGKHPGRPSLFERAIKRHGLDAVATVMVESIARP
jgi:hypothetical protein